MLLLAVYLLFPLVQGPVYLPLPWGRYQLNIGQGWQHYLVPSAILVGLLVLPGVVRMSVGPVGIEPRAPEPRSAPELEPQFIEDP